MCRNAYIRNNIWWKIKEIQTQFPLLSQYSSVKDVIHKVQGLDKDKNHIGLHEVSKINLIVERE